MDLHPESLNIISLCTGGGGLDLGVELAIPSARSVVLMEREAFAISQLVSAMESGLMAPAPVWSDVTTFNGRPWRGLVDGVIGGIPCQPHSLAGKREGSDDERDLWSDARRIIVQSGSWWVLIENVRGMLSAKPGLDPGALRVRRDLQRLGFRVEGGLFTAAEVGASHERERVFILGVANSFGGRREQGRGLSSQGHGRTERDTSDGSRNLPGVGQADADDPRSQGRRHGDRALGRQDPERHAGLGGRELVDAESVGRGEGRPEPSLRSGRDTCAGRGVAMDDPSIARGGPIPIQPRRQDEAYRDTDRPSDDPRRVLVDPESLGEQRVVGDEADAQCAASRREQIIKPDERCGRANDIDAGGGVSLFAPAPGEISRWRDVLARSPELEPAFRRVADGLASRLDTARVDRLRMLGNGVVPLEAAYALRTLCTRLAGRGSAGAAELVRLMEFTA